MRGTRGSGLVQAVGVEGETKGGTDTRAESLGVAEAEDTSVVDLGLDESGRVKVSAKHTFMLSLTSQRSGKSGILTT